MYIGINRKLLHRKLFLPLVLKLDMKDSFRYNKEIERMEKTFPTK